MYSAAARRRSFIEGEEKASDIRFSYSTQRLETGEHVGKQFQSRALKFAMKHPQFTKWGRNSLMLNARNSQRA
jgi:hypothetical protein